MTFATVFSGVEGSGQGLESAGLTPREFERLQGFPDDWTRWGVNEKGETVEISDAQRYKMCGNAVTATVPKWMAKNMLKVA